MPSPSATDAWRELAGAYEVAVRDYAASLGQDPRSDATESTVKTNTELVPRRAGDVMGLLREFAGIESIRGLRVLDLGCGWGSIATYLAWKEEPARMVAVDNRDDFIEAASACTRAAGVTGVEYVLADITTLEPLPDRSFDVLIANNTLPYLNSARALDAALSAAFRVAAPGGVVVAFHANRSQLRDPFTNAPFVHRLPPRVAARVTRVTGWQNSHDRVRLTSPRMLARALHDAGFADVTSGSVGSDGRVRRSAAGRFYGTVARRPTNS